MARQIVLQRLTLRNFKGIRDFTLETNGGDVSIYGDNAVGKTTLFDAFTWLLFDKDSQNKKDFQIKTLDVNGNVLHGLNHEVEGTLLVDGRTITLRKVFSEKWTKKRGSATPEFTGHTTDYYVDGVPVKQKEYKERVDAIISEDIFKLLTSPTFFNEQLHWQERRRILLEVCGDVSDKDVIASNPALAGLPAILDGRSIEEQKKVVLSRRKQINDELEKIPVRIDEANRSMPELPEESKQFYESHIGEMRDIIRQKQEEIVRIQSGGGVVEKQNRIREIEGDLLDLKNRLQGDSLERIAAARREESRLRQEVEDLKFEIDTLERRINRNNLAIQLKESERERLRQQWYAVNDRVFVAPQHDENCTACGQPLPTERIAEAHRRAEEAFNLEKSRELEGISRQGKALADEIEELKRQNEADSAKIESLRAELHAKKEAYAAAGAATAELEASRVDVTSTPEYQAKQAEIERLRAEIAELQQNTAQAVATVREEIAWFQEHIAELEREKAKFELSESARKRISELEQQEKELAAEFERLEQELFLTEEFIRTKVNLLEEKINSKFRFARFKLFEQQINGGLVEVCETTFNGVPYSGGLNNAARINVGLDIINTLAEHYGISAPIFIDNAEAITNLIETSGQQIRLVVSEKDKQLRVETAKQTMREAV